LTAAISAHSVQAAPAALSNAVAAAALSKSVAAGASTLTLIKGALKIMAWSKAKTAVVIGAGILLAAGTGTITVKEIHARRAYPWQVQYANSDVLRKVPPQVKIVPARFRSTMGAGVVWENDGQAAGSSKVLGISQPVQTIVTSAYGQSSERTLFSAKVPSGKFDFIANLPSGNREALQNEIRQTFALTGRQATKETEVLLLKVSNANASGLKPNDPQRLEHNASSSSRSGAGYFNCRNQRISNLAEFLESHLKVPVVDQTQLTGNFDVDLKWDESDYQHPNEDGLKQAVLDQLGLELVPAREPVQMLVVEKAK
jgi:uncharacterized protein (TIGR03435 family)